MSRADYALEIEPGKQEIVGTRTFDAPRDLVFKTMMDPKLIPRRWGPRNHTTTVDEIRCEPAALGLGALPRQGVGSQPLPHCGHHLPE
jgi:uncharacterized protein YndB with AHSA1/START domain